jgi:dsDNA-specific endonuclease/ATPase MutS2
LGNLNASEDINRAWKNIKENIKTSGKESLGLNELEQHKPCFDKECLRFLDQRKQAKMQWVQDPTHTNVDHLSNVRRESSRHFRKTKRENLKSEIDELETLRPKISEIRKWHKCL